MAYVLVRWGGYGVKEVAECFRGDPTTISSLLSRYEQNIQEQAERYRGTDLRSLCLVIQARPLQLLDPYSLLAHSVCLIGMIRGENQTKNA
jgi:hypothetical protein